MTLCNDTVFRTGISVAACDLPIPTAARRGSRIFFAFASTAPDSNASTMAETITGLSVDKVQAHEKCSDSAQDEHLKPPAHEDEAHLSFGDMLRATAVAKLTPFERKAALINA